jgi:hypothetical protein
MKFYVIEKTSSGNEVNEKYRTDLEYDESVDLGPAFTIVRLSM